MKGSCCLVPPRPVLWVAVAIIAATVLAYLPVWRSGYIWDDNYYVSENQALEDLDGLRRIWFDLKATPQYYPLVHTSYWLEYRIWGTHPAGYHIVNVLLHALNAVVLWRVLRRLRLPGALPAAVIFALHPVHVESVAWITERKNTLSGLFYLLSLFVYSRFASLASPERPKQDGGGYALALFLYVCALLSKTVTCSLPAVIVLLLWMRRKRFDWRDYAPLLPFFIIGAALGLLTAWMEKHHVGARGDDWAFTVVDRCLIAGRALWFYLGKLLVPVRLTFIYPQWEINAGQWWQYLFPLSAAGVGIFFFLARYRIGKKPLAAALFFAFTLTPALGFFDVYPMRFSFVADHFQYLASIGPIALFAGLAEHFARRNIPRRAGRLALAAAALLLGTLSWKQTLVYKDLETLWRDTISKNPKCWMAMNNLANLLKQQGESREALELYRRALSVKPAYGQANANLASMLVDLGDFDGAIRHCLIALEENPDYVVALNNMGVALQRKGLIDEAIRSYKKALDIHPAYESARNNLQTALLQKEKVEQDIALLADRIRENPEDIEARNEWGAILFRTRRYEEAAERFREALCVKPDDTAARNGLGLVLAAQGKLEDSLRQHLRAVETDPENPAARYYLALALDRLGKTEQAVVEYKETLARDPDHLDAHNNLGAFYAIKGRLDDAIFHFEHALRINPGDLQARHNLDRARTEKEKRTRSR